MASLRKEVYKPETDFVKKKKATFADGEPFKFGQTAGGVQGNLENLKIVKEQINKDVKISETGKQEFAKELSRLQERRKHLTDRVAKCRMWSDVYEKDIGPMENGYEHLCADIHVLYGAAKEKHAKGLQLLYKHFDYHPIYKHWDDTFT
eukprot:CAMPEP_0198212072 /NCGR_PEP_ID=MMETSP1445-20131203/25507_1 /TAXON_ID=36898 /ORGANISM="Pyramimonas sp., Strain CCMP2087" /LENGTH=148 /DNA_ID=CAMNT_0043886451 /DNA_START=261 /DNA_END=704 /DNA_ORIENTATION=+